MKKIRNSILLIVFMFIVTGCTQSNPIDHKDPTDNYTIKSGSDLMKTVSEEVKSVFDD